jgi:hypothetical protein
LSRNKLYLILIISCTVGYVWLFYNYSKSAAELNSEGGVCIIKRVTDIPCPSCGATRSALSFLHGDFLSAIYWNPIGVLLICIMAISPFWVAYDYLTSKSSLLHFYLKVEEVFRQKKYAIPAIALILANWIWNIYKGL